MIDFWEMLGRMVTNQNFLNALVGFKKVQYTVGSDQRALIPNDPSTIGGQLNDDYYLMRQIVQQYMPGKPLSLMALGEMLYALTIPAFRVKGQIAYAKIAQMGIPAPQNDYFYVALGAMILDDGLRSELVDNNNWNNWGFDSVAAPDRASLTGLLNVNQNADVVDAVHNFCLTGWDIDCNDRVIEWVGHTHPVAP
jgi:hypothetical protein